MYMDSKVLGRTAVISDAVQKYCFVCICNLRTERSGTPSSLQAFLQLLGPVH